MTCSHVLGLIDAGPFADYPAAHLEAAWRHASQCPTCGPALSASRALASHLAALAQPAPPPDLAAAVLARIARLEDRAAPLSAVSAGVRSATPAWPAWAATLGALAAAVAIVLPMWREGAPLFIDAMSPGRLALVGGLVPLPDTFGDAAMLAGALVLYAAGLFAALGNRTAASN